MLRIRYNLTDKKGDQGVRPFLHMSTENLVTTLRDAREPPSPLFEYILQDDLCRPSWDAESYIEAESPEKVALFEQFCRDAIARQLSGLLSSGIRLDLAVATRHGLCPLHAGKPRPYKISYRFYLQGAAVVWKDMHRLVARANPLDASKPDGSACPIFDTSIYSVERHMGCVLCPKTKTDRRVLRPQTDHGLEAFFILAPPGDAIRLDIPEIAPVAAPLPIRPTTARLSDYDRQSGSTCTVSIARSSVSIPTALTVNADWAARFLDLISPARLAQREEWLKVSMACRDNPEDLFDVWDARCAQAPGYDAAENRRTWDSLQPGKGRTFATVLFMAKEDAPRRLGPLLRQFLAERSQASYERLQEDFEKRHFKVLHPLCFGVVQPGGDIDFVSRDTLRNMYENLFYERDKPFIPAWLVDPGMRSYLRVCFCPPPEVLPEGCFNLYSGMRVETLPALPETEVDQLAQPFFDHVKNVICNGEPRAYSYMRKWLANIVQEPGRKSQVAIVLQGEPGVGKNICMDFFRDRIIGSGMSFQTADPQKDVFARFSRAFYRTLWVQIDEATRELHKASDLLKNAITAPTVPYEKKGVDPITIGMYARVVMSSNHADPVKIESGDRRYCIFVCSSLHKGNSRYFQQLGAHLERDDVARAVYQVLLRENLHDIHFQNDRPITELYQALQEENIPSWGHFLVHLYQDACEKDPTASSLSVPSSELHKQFVDFCEHKNLPSMTLRMFSTVMSALPAVHKVKTRSCNNLEFNLKELHELIRVRNWLDPI